MGAMACALVVVLLFSLRRDKAVHVSAFQDPMGFEAGLPSEGCYGNGVERERRYEAAFQRAYAAFQRGAPRAVLQATKDFEYTSWMDFIDHLDWMQRGRIYNFAVRDFGGFYPGATAFKVPTRHGIRRPDLMYVRIWKSANDAIRYNLEKIAGRGRKLSANWAGQANVFTFVREPVGHFVAAYNEVEYRWSHSNTTWSVGVANYSTELERLCAVEGCIFPAFEMGTAERVWAFVGDLILGKLRDFLEVQHVYPQSGILMKTALELDFVGKLERFQEDWDKMLRAYVGDADRRWDASLRHPSHGFIAGIAGKKAIHDDPRLAEVLRELMFMDFACYGYPADRADAEGASRQERRQLREDEDVQCTL
jgi:hypothetical protein